MLCAVGCPDLLTLGIVQWALLLLLLLPRWLMTLLLLLTLHRPRSRCALKN